MLHRDEERKKIEQSIEEGNRIYVNMTVSWFSVEKLIDNLMTYFFLCVCVTKMKKTTFVFYGRKITF